MQYSSFPQFNLRIRPDINAVLVNRLLNTKWKKSTTLNCREKKLNVIKITTTKPSLHSWLFFFFYHCQRESVPRKRPWCSPSEMRKVCSDYCKKINSPHYLKQNRFFFWILRLVIKLKLNLNIFFWNYFPHVFMIQNCMLKNFWQCGIVHVTLIYEWYSHPTSHFNAFSMTPINSMSEE